MKELYLVGTEIKTPPLSIEARREVGFLLRLLQKGLLLSLPHSRPMPSIGKGCHELRVNDNNNTWRIMYYIDAEAIVILDVFSKKRTKHRKNLLLFVKGVCKCMNSLKKGNVMEQEPTERVIKTSVEEFLDLSPVDMQMIELKLMLAFKLKQARQELTMTQTELAALLDTGQSRVAKMEAADSSVSTELLIRSLFSLGYTTQDIGYLLIS